MPCKIKEQRTHEGQGLNVLGAKASTQNPRDLHSKIIRSIIEERIENEKNRESADPSDALHAETKRHLRVLNTVPLLHPPFSPALMIPMISPAANEIWFASCEA